MTEPYRNELQRPLDGDVTRAAASSRRPSTSSDRERSDGRDHAETADFNDEVARSISAIERTVANFGSLKENIFFYKEMAGDLRQDLRQEKEHGKETRRRLDEAERVAEAERQRAIRAETAAAAFADVTHDLERQLEKLRSQTARLVKAVSILMSADQDAPDDSVENGFRSVA